MEPFKHIPSAIAREKFLKHCTRAEKLALIGQANPTWTDLSPPQLATPSPSL